VCACVQLLLCRSCWQMEEPQQSLGSCGGFAGRCRSRRSQGTCSLLLRLHFLYTLTACSRSPAPSPLPSIPSCLAQLCRPSSGLPAWHLQCDNRGTCPAAALAPSRFCAPIRARAARSSPLTGPRTAPRRAEALLFSTAGSSFQQRNFSRIYSPWSCDHGGRRGRLDLSVADDSVYAPSNSSQLTVKCRCIPVSASLGGLGLRAHLKPKL